MSFSTSKPASFLEAFHSSNGKRLQVDSDVDLVNIVDPLPSEILHAESLRHSSSDHTFESYSNGVIAMLPNESDVQMRRPSEWFTKQATLTPGAFFHPVVVLQHHPQAKDLLFVGPLTSWGGRSLGEKFANTSQAMRESIAAQYLSMRTEGAQPSECDTIDRLEHTGPEMPKASYMSLTQGFWIPSYCLDHYRGRERKLTANSVHLARWAYTRAEIHRRIHGISQKVPESRAPRQLLTPPPSPPSSGRTTRCDPWTSDVPALTMPVTPAWRQQDRQRSMSPKKKEMMAGSWR
ncbi:unnamed protein product [Zymoseptoria tritici ST99CH_1E4]|uniref:Uncharacterized protein n=2 Tax=Zymoseptoria tritici TaxID=1047171 RepID=F9XNY9_ZYMTI|nr:uncharacterized protein MYCGRDRAFT_111522 [Zymoseptoria tritici IPO323]EGP83086.1 hypothetical protein MYCGRDRAFT_111522 [Zymoseptoria tritici IPO323]SMR61016.1 unnamed protein product [Zymoseptoria tritici ST99CH_1E4]